MTQDDNSTTGWNWNATDSDEAAVQVRSSSPPHSSGQSGGNVGGIHADHPSHREILMSQTQQIQSPRSMGAAAILGVTVVLLSVGIYAGIGSIRGDVGGGGAGSDGSTITVTITSASAFDPSTVSVNAGQVVTITNLNQNPQVLKPMDGNRELFPIQTLFSTPYTFTVPASANGAYVYYSQTLPSDKTLTFNVSPVIPIPFGDGSSASADIPIPFGGSSAPTDIPIPFGGSNSSVDIPIPFGGSSSAWLEIPIPFGKSLSSSSVSSSKSSVSSSSSSSSQSIIDGGGRQGWGGGVCAGGTCYVTGGGYQQPVYTPSAPIGVNPYTVGTRPTAVIAAATAAKAQGIHEGAAIDNQLTTHRPTTVSDTGPANMVLLMIPALLGAVLLYRRKVQA